MREVNAELCRKIRMLDCTPKELAEAVLELLPAAEFADDNTGQLVIYTGLRWDGNRLRVLIPNIPKE